MWVSSIRAVVGRRPFNLPNAIRTGELITDVVFALVDGIEWQGLAFESKLSELSFDEKLIQGTVDLVDRNGDTRIRSLTLPDRDRSRQNPLTFLCIIDHLSRRPVLTL